MLQRLSLRLAGSISDSQVCLLVLLTLASCSRQLKVHDHHEQEGVQVEQEEVRIFHRCFFVVVFFTHLKKRFVHFISHFLAFLLVIARC